MFTSRRRVAFKSNAVVRCTRSPAGFCCKCSARVSAVCFQVTFPVLPVQIFLSCCTTRAKAMGVTERSRRYVYFNCRRGRAIRLISLNTYGLDSLVSLDMFRVEGERVSYQRVMYLMHCFPPPFMMCAVVWHCVPAAVVHGLWCRHCDQEVETLVKLRCRPRVVETCGAKLSTA